MPGCGASCSSQRWKWLALLQWRSLLRLLLAVGHYGGAGWPPRPSRRWTGYCVFVAALLSVPRIWAVQNGVRQKMDIATLPYVNLLFTVMITVKNLATLVTQVLVIRHRFETTVLVQALDSYMSWCPPSPRAWRRMALLLAWMLATTIIMPCATLSISDYQEYIKKRNGYILEDLFPSVLLALTDSASGAVLAACVVLGQDVADDLRDQVQILAEEDEQEDVLAARRLRALRSRQQLLLDVVRASSFAHGGVNMCCLLVTIEESAVTAYSGIFNLQGYIRPDSTNFNGSAFDIFWFLILMNKFVSNCILGQQLCKTSARITATLDGFLAKKPAPPSSQAKRELEGFSQQVQQQDCRFMLFNLLYFDVPTMGAVLSSFATLLVILFQFSTVTTCPSPYGESLDFK